MDSILVAVDTPSLRPISDTIGYITGMQSSYSLHSMKEAVLLLVGWILGMASHLILQSLESRRESKKFKKTLKVELREQENRFAWAAYKLETRFGKFDREFVEWFVQRLLCYNGLRSERIDNDMLQKLRTFSDTDRHGLQMLERARGNSLGLKKYHLPYLEAHLDLLTRQSAGVQAAALELLAQLGMVHEEIDLAMSQYALTFDGSISPENHGIVKQNLDNAYKNLARMYRGLSDRAHSLLSQLE